MMIALFPFLICCLTAVKSSSSSGASSFNREIAQTNPVVSKYATAFFSLRGRLLKSNDVSGGDHAGNSGGDNSGGNGDNQNGDTTEDSPEAESDTDISKRRQITLPTVDVPILANFLQRSGLFTSQSNMSGFQSVNITVIQKFGSMNPSIFSNTTGQAVFQQVLGLTTSTLLSGIDAANVNIIYALRNDSSLYTNSRRLITTDDFIVKYTVSIFSEYTDMFNMTTILKNLKDELFNVTISGDFTTQFLNYSFGIDELSTTTIDTPPIVYLTSFPPPSQGTLFITQQFDNITIIDTGNSNGNGNSNSNSNSKSQVKNNFRDILAGTMTSFLLDTRLNDIKIKDITLLDSQSYQIKYRIPLRVGLPYASAYANLYRNIITNAVQTGLLTTQLELAATPTYYNNTGFLIATSSILPTYIAKYVIVGNETENESEYETEFENESPENENEIERGEVRFEQEINHIDVDFIHTPSGYITFQSIFKNAIVNSLYTISSTDIHFYGYREKVGRRRQLSNTGNIIVTYGITVYSATNDNSTLDALTSDLTSSLNDAIISGDFTNAFLSAAVTYNAASFTTASASTTPTISSTGSSGSTTTTSSSGTKKTTTDHTTIIVVLCIFIPIIVLGGMYILYKRYNIYQMTEEHEPLDRKYTY